MPVVDELGHLAKEERQQQGANVAAVNVGVGHQDDLVVANLGDVEIRFDAGPNGGDEGLDFGVLENFVGARLLDVQYLSADWQDRLVARIPRVLRRTAGRVSLDNE